MCNKNIVAFDFDGTITNTDTFPKFILFCKGPVKFLLGFLLFSPLIIAFLLKLYPSWKVKEKVFSFYFHGINIREFIDLCGEFHKRMASGLIKPKASAIIQNHLLKNDTVLIISANLSDVVMPFAKGLGIAPENVLATGVEIAQGRLTGKFSTPNCKGKEKVKRLLDAYPNRNAYRLTAYGDSAGDEPLLKFADVKHYRGF